MKKLENSFNKFEKELDRINDSVSTIYYINQLIMKIDNETIEGLREMAQNQLDYFSPLKMATTNRQHSLGKANMKVVEAIEALKIALEESGRIEQ